jgi:flagellar hook protein FlgE
MSFYTALTGLKGAQTDISTTSNNIANVGSSGFKKSRSEFGDIFGSSPLQTNVVGQGTITKSITQQFSQGSISQSTNTLDMAISGQGFFAMKSTGNPGQVVYTRNGAFNVSESGQIVDSAGQALLGYPVDSDGNVSDKTLQGAQKLTLKADYGEPKVTENISVGVNLPASAKVIPSDIEFNPNDPESYSASSSVTIFDGAGNPKSATVFYIKTQDPTATDQTYKYDTKMYVDGVELLPELTRATDEKGNAHFIDKFGQKTIKPEDTGYILEGKGSPLYRADDLGQAVESTPATITGQSLSAYLGDGKTVEIVTDPMLFAKTMEYQELKGVENPTPGTFWGKDFLLVDVDKSGPVSIDIPPGTYNGTQLAAAVQNALRDAFGDDKQIQLTDNIDNSFTIDLKVPAGDGKAKGLTNPITVDLHAAAGSIAATADEAKAGLTMDRFLVHAQRLLTDAMNAYIQTEGSIGDDVTAAANELNVSGRMFKKEVGAVIDMSQPMPTASDVISFQHTNPQVSGGAAVTRYLAYSNVESTPEIKAYDVATNAVLANITKDADTGYLKVTIPTAELNGVTDLEVLRFQQNAVDGTTQKFSAEVGTDEIAIRSSVVDGANTVFLLNHLVEDDNIVNTGNAGEAAIKILGKPSDFVEAYFDDTKGLVEGVSDVFYSKQLVIREIQKAAQRTTATDADNSGAAFGTFAAVAPGSSLIAEFGLDANGGTESINWIDDRDPAIRIGYDETNQRLTFDGVSSQLGKGVGVGFDLFTVYSKKLDSGENGLGIEAFGNNKEIDLKTEDILYGKALVPNGPEVRVENKRYGMEVEYDTVQTQFVIRSGTTGEALRANSAVGVTEAQNESSVAVGRYSLTETGARDQTDDAEYAFNKIGNGTAQILGFPRDGVEGYEEATGLVSKPAVAVGGEALMNMSQAFTISALGGENIVNVVVDGVSASIVIPEGNYKGTTLAAELQTRINNMKNPVSGASVGGVKVTYDSDKNNLTFTTATTGEGSTLAINGALRFGLNDVPLGLGETAEVRQPVQATDELGRPLYISPTGEITANNQDFADNMVQDYYPLYLDEGELTFDMDGNVVSPITKVDYIGLLKPIGMDFSNITQLDKPFSADGLVQDGYAAGRLTNLEIDNFGNVNAGYSNGQNVALGKIIVVNFANNSGLKQIGNSSFLATEQSGDPELGEAASDGFGQILSGSLERSNVDITEELVNLITSQRNYQAAAKAIETSSSMTQTIINIRS